MSIDHISVLFFGFPLPEEWKYSEEEEFDEDPQQFVTELFLQYNLMDLTICVTGNYQDETNLSIAIKEFSSYSFQENPILIEIPQEADTAQLEKFAELMDIKNPKIGWYLGGELV